VKLEDVFALESVRTIEVKGGPTMKKAGAKYYTHITVKLAIGAQEVPVFVRGEGETLGASYGTAVFLLRDELHERLVACAQAAAQAVSTVRDTAFKLSLKLKDEEPQP